MDQEQTIALFERCEAARKKVLEAGRSDSHAHAAAAAVWNGWANDLLARQEALQAEGRWDEESDVDFSGIRFVGLTGRLPDEAPENPSVRSFFSAEMRINFRGYIFPGSASFRRATFKGHAFFASAVFKGSAFFASAIFSGDVSFDNATFSNTADFRSAKFSAHASFRDTVFEARLGGANFADAIFSRPVYFDNATFSGQVVFESATFSGSADFASATFKGSAFFDSATFSGDAFFVKATFHKTGDFEGTEFHKRAQFVQTRFRELADFNQAVFGGYTRFENAVFRRAEEHEIACQADFTAARADRGFSLIGVDFEHLPNFDQANFREAPRLDNLKLPELAFNPPKWWCRLGRALGPYVFQLSRARDYGDAFKTYGLDWGRPNVDADAKDDEAKYRALKRLAIQAHDHASELRFFKGEKRAAWLVYEPPKHLSWLRWIIDCLRWLPQIIYDGVSDFGQSVARPLLIGLGLFFLSAFVYWLVASHPCSNGCIGIFLSLKLAARNALPVIGGHLRFETAEAYYCLYGYTGAGSGLPLLVKLLGPVQSFLSVPLVFFLLLALRNRFRI